MKPLQVYEALHATRADKRVRDLALFAARVGLAWIFIYHGAHTLFGAFGPGGGVHNQAVYFADVAHLTPATFFAVLGGIIEFFGGIGVGVGFFGRLAAAGLVGDMVMAMITTTFRNGIAGSSAGSGYELNIALAALAFVIFLMGTGRLSLDNALRQLLTERRPVGPAVVAARPLEQVGATRQGISQAAGPSLGPAPPA